MPISLNTSTNLIAAQAVTPFEFKKYKPSELPSPNGYPGAVIVLTDEDGTNSRQVYSNGTAWLTVANVNKPQIYDGSQGNKIIRVREGATGDEIPIVNGVANLDLSRSNAFRVTVPAAGISNFTASNLPQGNITLIIELNYVGAGGITWDRNVIKFFNGGQEPTITNQAGKTDVLSCTCNGAYLGCTLNPDLA